jgi:hypothetical protein
MASYESIDYGSPDGSIWGLTAADKIATYGAVPVIQRAYSSAVHATAGVASSASFGPVQTAALHEIQKTLIGLGIYATA